MRANVIYTSVCERRGRVAAALPNRLSYLYLIAPSPARKSSTRVMAHVTLKKQSQADRVLDHLMRVCSTVIWI